MTPTRPAPAYIQRHPRGDLIRVPCGIHNRFHTHGYASKGGSSGRPSTVSGTGATGASDEPMPPGESDASDARDASDAMCRCPNAAYGIHGCEAVS